MSGNKNSAPFSDLERLALSEAIRHEFGKKLDLSEIEDAVEEGIEKTTLAMQVQVIENPNGYAQMASRHAAIKIIRRKNRECSIKELPSELDAEDHAEKSLEAMNFVHHIYKRMPNAWVEALQLSSEGYSVKEIAKKMNRSEPAMYKLLERAKDRFYEIGTKLGMPNGGGQKPRQTPQK